MNGPSQMNKARELRNEIAGALRDSLPSCAFVLSDYFIRKEPISDLQEEGAHILARTKGASADSAIIDLVERPHINSRITETAIEAVDHRGLHVTSRAVRDFARGTR